MATKSTEKMTALVECDAVLNRPTKPQGASSFPCMPLRALRLLPLPTSAETTSLSFVSTLQLAAGRAWSRRVNALSRLSERPVGSRMRSHLVNNDSDDSPQAGPSDTKRTEHRPVLNPSITERKSHIQRVKHTDRKANTFQHSITSTRLNCSSLNVTVPQTHEQGRTPLVLIPPEVEVSNTFYVKNSQQTLRPHPPLSVSPELPPATSSPMSHPPKTSTALHQNLLYLINIRKPVLRLPVLLDYHTLYPDLQSTASFNLLISLSLRHGSFGITRQLFARLEMANIPKDTETYRLIVRWFILRGLWNNAWNFVQDLKAEGEIPKDIPYRLWLEFCRSPKPRRTRRFVNDEEGQLIRTFFERVEDNLEDLRVRQKLLIQNRPARVPTLANTSPFAIYCLAQLLIRTENRDRALALTQAYFKAMPRSMDKRNTVWCLNIIHVLMVSCPLKNGLPRFYETRRILVSLLKLHPRLRPNSHSLYLLLAPLRRAKRCGTIAWKTLQAFRSQWGKEVEDKRVQRRVTQLALKEGRMDVVKKFVFVELPSRRRYRKRRLNEEGFPASFRTVPPLSQTRLPSRELYFREGREARLWVRLKMKTYHTIQKRGKNQSPKDSKKEDGCNVRTLATDLDTSEGS